MKRYAFTVAGETFAILSDEQDTLLGQAAELLDQRVKLTALEAHQGNEHRKKLFACLALSCAVDLLKQEQRVRTLCDQIDVEQPERSVTSHSV